MAHKCRWMALAVASAPGSPLRVVPHLSTAMGAPETALDGLVIVQNDDG